MMRQLRVLAFVSSLLISPAARAWDPAGHMLVGQIAWLRSTPAVREKVDALVKDLEATYNEGKRYNFVTAGCWMDDMRSKKDYAWSKWHYVNIPWTADGSAFALPQAPHVVSALDESLQTLRDPASSRQKRVEAVGMLIHFVGDIHQPLHATDRGDRGGNGVLVTGVPFTDLWPGTVPNLHAFWDKAFRFEGRGEKIVELWQCPPTAERPAADGEGVIRSEAMRIMEQYPEAKLPLLAVKSGAVDWARESHLLGCKAGYPPGAEAGDDRVTPIPPEFASSAQKIAMERIALAGYRLGQLLSEVLGD